MFSIFVEKKNYINIIGIIFICFLLNVPYSIFATSFYRQLPLLVVIPGMLYSVMHYLKYKKIDKALLTGFSLFIIPLVLVTVIAAITAEKVYDNNIYTLGSLGWAFYACISYLLGYYMIQIYGYKKLFSIILWACIISYSSVIVKYIYVKMQKKNIPVSLEVHELTYIFAYLFVLHLLFSEFSKSVRRNVCIVCLIAIIIGGKRAAFLAIVISLLVYWVFFKILHNKKFGLKVLSIICVIIGLLWVWVIHSGILEQLVSYMGIDDMSRLIMWNFIKNSYDVSLFYWGRGLTYSDVLLLDSYRQLRFSQATTLHNEILRIYIGWGFLPFCYYIWVMMYSRIIIFVKKNLIKEAWIFLAISIEFFIIIFFGNTLFSTASCFVYYSIWQYLLFYSKENVENA